MAVSGPLGEEVVGVKLVRVGVHVGPAVQLVGGDDYRGTGWHLLAAGCCKNLSISTYVRNTCTISLRRTPFYPSILASNGFIPDSFIITNPLKLNLWRKFVINMAKTSIILTDEVVNRVQLIYIDTHAA